MQTPPPARAAASNAPAAPETEWQIGLAALAAIGLVGGGAIMAANARRRRESLAAEQDAYEEAAATEATAIAPAFTPATRVIPAAGTDVHDGLIAEMVAAPPDAANPFRTRKARRRRAQIILARREADLRAQASRPFDWRTYQSSAQRGAKERVN